MLRLSFRALATLFGLVASTGCASLPPLIGPDGGGRPWHELSTEHLVLATDLNVDEASKRAIEFEHLYAGLRRARGANDLHRPILIVFFTDPEEFHQFAPERQAGFATLRPPGDFDGPAESVFSSVGQTIQHLFLHELGHQLNHERFFSLPTWLDEGLAEYSATLEVEDDGHVLIGGEPESTEFFGRLVSGNRRGLDLDQVFTIRQIIAADHDNFASPAARYLYPQSEVLVQMLMAGPYKPDSQAFARMLSAMEKGSSGGREFDTEFEGNIDALEQRYKLYLGDHDRTATRFIFRDSITQGPGLRTMSPAEVHILFGEMVPDATLGSGIAEKQLDKALALEPSSAEALYARASLFVRTHKLPEAEEKIDLALEKSPDDPRFLALRSYIRRSTLSAPNAGAEQHAQWAKEAPPELEHLERVARTAHQMMEIAAVLHGERDPTEASVYADRAVTIDSSCTGCWMVKAASAIETGHFLEAETALLRLETLDSDYASPGLTKGRRALTKALAEAEKKEH
jgi:tetratricopeptide (TPR) repeat protein